MEIAGKATAWIIGLTLTMLLAACAPSASPAPTKAPAVVVSPTQAAQTTTVPATPAAKPTTAPQSTPAAQATPVKPTTVRFGSPGPQSDAGVFIAIENGYFKDLGLEVQILPFQSGPLMVAPLASGDLEVAGGSISTALFNAIDRGVAIKTVAGKGSSIKGFEFSIVGVRKDLIDGGQIKEIKDLKGKNIGVASTKSGAEAIVSYLLKQGGINIQDVNLVALGYPDMAAGFTNKAIDAAVLIEPTLNALVQRGLVVRWGPGATSSIYGGEYQAAEMNFSEQFSKNTDAARRFMVGYLKGMRAYNDAFVKGVNKAQIVSIMIKYTADKDPVLFDQMQMPFLNPDGKMHLASMQMDFDFFKQMGYYTGNLTLNSIVDSQFTDYAVQQLGPYK